MHSPLREPPQKSKTFANEMKDNEKRLKKQRVSVAFSIQAFTGLLNDSRTVIRAQLYVVGHI